MTGQFTAPSDLPPAIPIFPLSGALLLPRGMLPLNIFEPRYITMVEDALARPDRLIGMVQPRSVGWKRAEEETSDVLPGDVSVFEVGCAGRITAMDETDDGRYLITLTGISRYAIQSESLAEGGYRVAKVSWERFAPDLRPAEDIGLDRGRLGEALAVFFDRNHIEADWQAIRETPDERLVTSLCMICPFEPSEKQALLECADMVQRAELMTSLIEMAAMGGQAGDEGPRH